MVECMPWLDIFARYDRLYTLLYLDPPCLPTKAVTPSSAPTTRLAEVLRDLGGRFILSINDVPENRCLFTWAEIREIATTYTIGLSDGTLAAELIITGGNLVRHEAPRLL